ncbi:DUF6082 family protein [Streptomyces sp. MST-110588]|uniref:DUF6082 family protein n=1 Tax=Streptomyces sp. MST-110588 TaxID=2833628 RepID=UPI001F5D84D1|nr:DUF6082 family protein [Streptomyces sp. MST-110588]UNO41987.1 hypothetical protein KGS77_23730 [Streptomyces sp. MST-110588]
MEETQSWPNRLKQAGLTIGAVLIACLCCAALSVLLVHIPGLQSAASSNAGQAFGAAAAASSAVVLFYMARTMRMQENESKMQRLALSSQQEVLETQCRATGATNGELHRTSEALIRGLHMSLMKMAMNDPELAATWPLYDPEVCFTRNKQFFYINQVLSMHLLMYEVGYSERHLGAGLRYQFSNPLWREFWETRRAARGELVPPDTVEGEFSQVVERAYQAALTTTPLRRHG